MFWNRKRPASPESLAGVLGEIVETEKFLAEVVMAQGDRTTEVLRSSVKVTGESVGMARRAMAAAEESVGMARHAMAVANLAINSQIREMPPGWRGDTLSDDELTTFAEMFPEWSVTTGIANGVATKVYARSIDKRDLKDSRLPGGKLDRDTYLALCDAENSDMQLAQFFDSYTVFGDDVNGRRYDFRIVAEEAGPITMSDVVRISEAEEYLREEYLSPYYETPELADSLA